MASMPSADHEKSKSPLHLPDKDIIETTSARPSFNRSTPFNGSMDSESEAPPIDYAGPGTMVSLSRPDHIHICRAIGAAFDDESHSLLHPKSAFYPPKGLPAGLYRDVIRARVFCAYQFYFCMIWFNVSLFLQLILGAATTALASSSKRQNDTSLTVLAAMNTVNAGILALMHNSGLPDRYKNDWTEYEKVEMCLKALIEGGVVREGLRKEDIIADCYERYAKAKDTVQKNKPSAYAATATAAIPQPASPPPK